MGDCSALITTQSEVDAFCKSKILVGIECYNLVIDYGAEVVNCTPELGGSVLAIRIIYEVNGCQALTDKRSKAGRGLVSGPVIQNNSTNRTVHLSKPMPIIPLNSELDTVITADNQAD